MMNPSGSIYEIRWNELCPWLILTKALRVSLLIRVLLYAWLGLMLTQWGWSAIESMAGNSQPQLQRLALQTPSDIRDIRELKAVESRLMANSLFHDQNSGGVIVHTQQNVISRFWNKYVLYDKGPLAKGWELLSSPVVLVFEQRTTFVSGFFKLLCGVWAIAVWALFGGMIARTSARYCTRDEIIGPLQSGRAAITKWPSTAGGPLIALLFALLMTIPLAIAGIFMRADVLAMVAGLLWVFALVWGILLAIVLVALWFGWPLMWATIAVERSDAFDAASRTAAYIYQRPLRLVFYVVVASILGIFGQLVVSGFAAAGSHITDWAVSWGAGNERIVQLAEPPMPGDVGPTLAGSAAMAARSISFWKEMLASVAAAYPLAFLFSASVGIYLLLRLHIDSTEVDEIVLETGEDSSATAEIKASVPEILDDPEDISGGS